MIDREIQRQLDQLLRGWTTAAGEFSLNNNGIATTTTVTRTGVSANSVVLAQALSALATNADITRIVPAKDSFTVTHPASANIRTYRYVFFSGKAT